MTTEQTRKQYSTESITYIISLNRTTDIDISMTWMGLVNHALSAPKAININGRPDNECCAIPSAPAQPSKETANTCNESLLKKKYANVQFTSDGCLVQIRDIKDELLVDYGVPQIQIHNNNWVVVGWYKFKPEYTLAVTIKTSVNRKAEDLQLIVLVDVPHVRRAETAIDSFSQIDVPPNVHS
jgi:hypothetical protein